MNLSEKLIDALGDAVEVSPPRADQRWRNLAPDAVAAPRDETAARELVAWCGKNGHALLVRGGGTRWEAMAAPSRFEVLLCTRHLDLIFDHDQGNATLECGAGLTVERANAAVAAANQFVPLNVPSGSTVGGAVASSSSGSWRAKYGAPRDLVTGLHCVLSDGRLVKAGAKVVKNVAGYDLPKVIGGSWGTLGLITRVTIRLRPQDAATAQWQGQYENWSELEAAAHRISQGQWEPTALTAQIAAGAFVLSARFDGGERAVAQQVAGLGPPSSPLLPEASTAPVADEDEWVIRGVLPVQRAVEWARLAAARGARVVQWEVGLGVVRAAGDNSFGGESLASLRGAAEEAGGYLVIDKYSGPGLDAVTVWGPSGPTLELQRALKRAFDPAQVFAPGCFLGGI